MMNNVTALSFLVMKEIPENLLMDNSFKILLSWGHLSLKHYKCLCLY